MIIDWYENLSNREQRLVFLGSIIGIVALIYLLIWSPLTSQIDQMQNKVNADRELFVWMKDAVPTLQNRRLSGSTSLKTISPDSGITVIEQSLKDKNLDTTLKQISKDNSDIISLAFSDINFDSFIEWIVDLSSKNRLTVQQVSVTPTKQVGLVNISLSIRFE